MEGMCVMSLRESTVVTQEFKLTEITVSQLSVNYFTHTHRHTQNVRKKTASPCKVLSTRFTVHLHFSRWMRVCVCDVIHSFSYSAGGPGPVPALGGCRSVYFCRLAGTWDFLWVYCGWSTCKQHGPSSLLLLPLQAASAPAPPSCGSLVLRVTPRKHKLIRILTRAHWSHENQPSCRVNAGKHEPAQTHLDILQLLHLRD